MSDTPRTDAIGLQYDSDTFSRRTTDFARQLERELAAQVVYVEELTRAAFDFACHCTAVLMPHEEQALDRLKAALAKNPNVHPAGEGVTGSAGNEAIASEGTPSKQSRPAGLGADAVLEIGLGSRTPAEYAIEFGGYLAKSATALMDACNAFEEAREKHEGADPGDEAAAAYDVMHAAQEARSDAWSALRSAVYEFEKRRDRAAAERERVARFQAALDEEIDP